MTARRPEHAPTLSDRLFNRRLSAAAAEATTPPPKRAYGAFGARSTVVPPSRILTPACIFIGDDVTIHENSFISVVAAIEGVTPKLTIGDGSYLSAQTQIACVGEIEIGKKLLSGARVFIGDTYHRYEDAYVPIVDQPMAPAEKVTIGDGVFIGIGSSVLKGVTIGDNACIAAGAVVTRDVPARTLVAGNPARVIKRWDDEVGDWVSVGEPTG